MVERGFFPSAQGSDMVDDSICNRRCIGPIFLVISKAPLIFYVANGLIHVLLLMGWPYLPLKDELEHGLHFFWGPYFLFTISW